MLRTPSVYGTGNGSIQFAMHVLSEECGGRPSWPVDGHVHFHDIGFVESMLDAAAENFGVVTGAGAHPSGALLLAQMSTENVFELLRDRSTVGDWRITHVPDEAQTLLAQRDSAVLAIVCGRQVRAADGLEVLALGTCRRFPDNLSFAESVEIVHRSDALAVLPWGVGKWLGKRGSRVAAALEKIGTDGIFVGDNGGRLGLMGLPVSVRRFVQRGFRVLPGTDPFPFSGDMRRVGKFGFLAELQPDWSAPWRQLRLWLASRSSSPQTFGTALGPFPFVFNQVGIRVRSRRMVPRPA